MKSVYWRPNKLSPTTALMIGVTAVLALVIVELPARLSAPEYLQEKRSANELAEKFQREIHATRLKKGLRVNREFDPYSTGLVGCTMSSLTSKPGSLDAKQMSLHPQFPSVVVQLLRDAGVDDGDTIAIGWTGSFPGLNVSVAAAVEAMNLNALSVASVTSSQYGANERELTWLDMESSLVASGLLREQSLCASIGGPLDRGAGMSAESLADVRAAMQRNGVRELPSETLGDSIDARQELIERHAQSKEIAAYINVGGGVASCGGGDCVFTSGLTKHVVAAEDSPDCVMQRFNSMGIPVVHLARPKTLAAEFGLSNTTESWCTASVARGPNVRPGRLGAFAAFLFICGVLRAFILKDVGNRTVANLVRRLRGQPPIRVVGQQDGPQLMA